MTTTVSIAELQHAGVTLGASEAVAITQQLIQTLRRSGDAGVIEPPYGPPTAANVIINADGTVSCAACGTTPAISEIAIFLDALLPASSPGVPGGLRYTIARGLLEVDVAPFDSLDDFSRALSRYELGPRGDIIRHLLQRAEAVRPIAPGVFVDRRRARTTELRRALRDADAQLYVRQLAAMPPPPRSRAVPAVAVCVGSGLMLIAGGGLMQSQRQATSIAPPAAVPLKVLTAGTSAATAAAVPRPPSTRAIAPRPIEPPTPVRASRPAAVAPAAVRAAIATPPPVREAMATPAVRPVPLSPGEFGRSDRKSVRGGERAPETGVKNVRSPRRSRGILDRLRLRWLRNTIVIRVDEL